MIGTNKLSIPAILNCSMMVANNAIKGIKKEISWLPKYAKDPVIIKLTRNIVAVPINDFFWLNIIQFLDWKFLPSNPARPSPNVIIKTPAKREEGSLSQKKPIKINKLKQ